MTDYEPHDEHAHYDGGSAANGEQTYGNAPAPAPLPAPGYPPPGYPPTQPGYPPTQPGQPPAPPGQPPTSTTPPPDYFATPQTPPGYGQPSYGQPTYGQPGYSQPAYGQPTYGQPAPAATPPVGDYLTAGRPEPKRRLAPILTSVAVVVALILGAGAYTGYRLLASHGSQPDTWAPANSIAFGKLDLDPSASAKVAAWEFEKKFPDAPKVANADQLKDALLNAMFDGADGDPDYADIKPWLGNRVAFDVFLDTAGAPHPIGILEVKDSAKAKAELPLLATSGGGMAGYSVQGDYAIVGETQAIVDQAVAAAKKGNITTNANYKSDIAQLKDDRIATVWYDIDGSMQALTAELPGELAMVPMIGQMSKQKAGRLVMGLRVQPSYVELSGRVIGGSTFPAELNGATAATALGDLPSGTVAGLSIANPEQLLKKELDTIESSPLGAGIQDEFDAASAQLGISLPDDVENLLGKQVTVGIDALPAQSLSTLFVTLMTQPGDLPKALATVQALTTSLTGGAEGPFKTSTEGNTLVVTDDPAPTSGKLADDPKFQAALDGMPAQSTLAGYVDLSAFVAATPEAPADLGHLDSLGFYVGLDDASPVFKVRLSIK